MRIGVLALQGAFIEHQRILESLGCQCLQLRQKSDLDYKLDGIVLPGGESTVQGKLLEELEMKEQLQGLIEAGVPVLATCAGLILLAQNIANDSHQYLATLPVTVKRNAYGRQSSSFATIAPITGIGEFEMVFIRAPYIESVEPGVEVLATVDNKIVAVRYQNQLALAFHPELTADKRIHQEFVAMIRSTRS